VWYQSFRRRIPSTEPRPETDAGLGLPPNVLRKWYPSGNNLQTPSEPAIPKLTGLQAPSAVLLASNSATSGNRILPMQMLGA
jgi:hypothetical protein